MKKLLTGAVVSIALLAAQSAHAGWFNNPWNNWGGAPYYGAPAWNNTWGPNEMWNDFMGDFLGDMAGDFDVDVNVKFRGRGQGNGFMNNMWRGMGNGYNGFAPHYGAYPYYGAPVAPMPMAPAAPVAK